MLFEAHLFLSLSFPPPLSLSLCFSFISFVQAMPTTAMPLQRKKSLPDVAQPIQLTATAPLSREEVSILSSLRREEIRRQIDESERLRANPLLYLVSPQVKVSILRAYLWLSKLFTLIKTSLRGSCEKREGKMILWQNMLRFIDADRFLRISIKNLTNTLNGKRRDRII